MNSQLVDTSIPISQENPEEDPYIGVVYTLCYPSKQKPDVLGSSNSTLTKVNLSSLKKCVTSNLLTNAVFLFINRFL
jgi:hypothetical protein